MYGRVPPDVFFGMVCYAPKNVVGTAEGTLGLNG